MFTKLDSQVISILSCPLCKGKLNLAGEEFVCRDCQSQYPKVRVTHTDHEESVYDFRVHRPEYCVPAGIQSWAETQEWYEKYHHKYASLDDLNIYLQEVDSVKEIYTDEFHIGGSVLDVGGHQGRLRHYLDNAVTLYVDVDPFLECFKGLESQPNLLHVFPSLTEPTNFVSCQAEYLPFVANSFDWVHMRSVLDHFYDPYASLKEAYRVLKPGGKIMIGVSLHEEHEDNGNNDAPVVSEPELEHPAARPSFVSRVSGKIERDGIVGFSKAVFQRIRHGASVSVPTEIDHTPPAVESVSDPVDEDRHMFHWRYEDLISLLRQTEFKLSKEHWQKPPYSFVIYLTATK